MKRLFFLILIFAVYQVMAQDTLKVSINGYDFVMVRVEGGTFHRGVLKADSLDSVRFKNSMGENDVLLSTFYIGKYEVTQELYYKVTGLKPSTCRPLIYDSTTKQIGLRKDIIQPNHPVESVTWYQAQAFIDSLNKLTGMHFRLPTEAEWEYAARGGLCNSPHPYAGGRNIDRVAWFHYEDPNVVNAYRVFTEKVGQKQPNALGLYDMTGNVAEWCSDWFSPTYYQTKKLFTNPKGPSQGKQKVIRGGSHSVEFKDEYRMEIRYRIGRDPNTSFPQIGFRLVLDAK